MELKGYTKKYGEKIIFDNFSLDFSEGSITVLLGNSGIGKTTLLNALAGLDDNYKGEIKNGEKCAYIFQEPRLLKGVSVYKNIELALPCADRKTVEDMLSEVELSEYAAYTPSELSGGMAQRVGMARAFISGRKVLLMDEPFSGLDYGLKYRLIEVFRKLWQKTLPTTVMITHNPDEALELADRIVVLGGAPVKIIGEITTDKLNSTDKAELRAEILGMLLRVE